MLWPNSPGPLTNDSSVNFHDVFFFIFAKLYKKMKKNLSWKFTDELSVTFQLSVSEASEFGGSAKLVIFKVITYEIQGQSKYLPNHH